MRALLDVRIFSHAVGSLICTVVVLSSLTAVLAEPLALDVRDATVGRDERAGAVILEIKLEHTQKEAWFRFTSDNLARRVELRIDGQTALTTIIREVMAITSLQISGLTVEAAAILAEKLSKAGVRVEAEVASN